MSKLLAAALTGAALSLALIAPAMAQPPSDAAAPAAKITVASPMKDILANPKAKEVLTKYAPMVVEYFASGDGVAMGDAPLNMVAENDQAQAGGLTPENMKKIEAELAGL